MIPSIRKSNLLIIIAFATSPWLMAQGTQATYAQATANYSAPAKSMDARIADELAQEQAAIAATQVATQQKVYDNTVAVRQRLDDLQMQTSLSLLGTPSSAGETLLLIPTPQTKPQDFAMIAEDTKIMSRILTKALREANVAPPANPYAANYGFLAHGMPSDQADALYIDDFGAIFFMKVDLPLMPGPQAQQENKAEEEAADPIWARTKQEIYEPQDSRFARRIEQPNEEYAEEYDPEKLQTLKTTLLETLRHAANMRTLKPGDSIILVIASSTDKPRDIDAALYSYTLTTIDKNLQFISAPSEVGSSRAATLILRVRKSDADSFAAGKLDMDQFTKKADILTLCAYSAPSRPTGPEPTSPVEIGARR